jgi:membrane-bound inhibitor of C-type lysozyme
MIVILVCAAIGVWWVFTLRRAPIDSPRLVSSVVYVCADDKKLQASFYASEVTEENSVTISFDGKATTTLPQAVSASGARYTTADESLVFWSKGDSALILREGTIDTQYRDCFVDTPLYRGWKATTTTELTFRYPEPYRGVYVSTPSWPPNVRRTAGEYTCPVATSTRVGASEQGERIIQDTPYCVMNSREGAAGSTYATWIYRSDRVEGVFVFRFPQCLNYDEPKQSACLFEQRAFDIDSLAHQVLSSVR